MTKFDTLFESTLDAVLGVTKQDVIAEASALYISKSGVAMNFDQVITKIEEGTLTSSDFDIKMFNEDEDAELDEDAEIDEDDDLDEDDEINEDDDDLDEDDELEEEADLDEDDELDDLDEKVSKAKVVRKGKRIKKWVTDKEGFKLVKNGNGKPKEVKMTPAEKKMRMLAGKKAARKSKGKNKMAAVKAARSNAKAW